MKKNPKLSERSVIKENLTRVTERKNLIYKIVIPKNKERMRERFQYMRK